MIDATPFVLILLAAVAASHISGVAHGRYLERVERIRRRVGTPQ